MILIELPETFEEYIKSLSKKAKKNYAYVRKHNRDLEYRIMPFVRSDVQSFMSLWEQQLIRGEYKTWAFGVEHIEELSQAGRIKVFVAFLAKKPIALQFIQRHEGFWDCHPPLYDKGFGECRYLAKYMWFELIKFSINERLGFLNMGGGIDESWREMIKRRAEFPNPAYKWMYVSEKTKLYPDLGKDYQIKELNGEKYLYDRSGKNN